MRTTLTLLFLSLIFQFKGQSQIDFFKTYGRPNMDESFVGIFPADTPGQMWVAGHTGSIGEDKNLLMKIDTLGNILWADTFGQPGIQERTFAFDRNPVSGHMVFGGQRFYPDRSTKAVLYSFDRAGNQLFEIELEEEWAFYVVRAFEDGSALAIYQQTEGFSFSFIHFNNIGEKIKEYPLTDYRCFQCSQLFHPLSNGIYYELVNESHDLNKNDLYLAKVLDTLNTDLSFHINPIMGSDSYTAFTFLPINNLEENIIHLRNNLSEKEYLVKIDKNKDLIWQEETSINYGNNWYRSFLFKDSNNHLGALSSSNLEVRNLETGELIAETTLSQLMGNTACFMGDAVYIAEKLQSGDANIRKYRISDLSFLENIRIGTPGLGDIDYNPFQIFDGENIFLFNTSGFSDLTKQDLTVRKCNKTTGDLFWEKEMIESRSKVGQGMILMEDKNLLIASILRSKIMYERPDSIELIKLDAETGNEIWRLYIDNESAHGKVVTLNSSDGGAHVFFQGLVRPNPSDSTEQKWDQLQYVKVNNNGEITKRNWYHYNDQRDYEFKELEGITYARDGNLLLYGNKRNTEGVLWKIRETTGEFLQSISLPRNENRRDNWKLKSVVEDSLNNYYFLSNNPDYIDSIQLYRYSSAGTLLNNKCINGGSWPQSSKVIIDNSGQIYLLLNNIGWSNIPNNYASLIKIDNQLNFLEERILLDEYQESLSANFLPDSKISITGQVLNSNSYDIFLMVADVEKLFENAPTSNDDFVIFPNPSPNREKISIKSRDILNNAFDVNIFSVDGKLLLNKSLPAQTNKVFEIQIPNLLPGIYAIQLQNETINWTGKLVVR